MKRADFVCDCGSPLEPSEIHIDPQVREIDGLAHYVGVCCVPDCDAPDVLVPVTPRILGGRTLRLNGF